MEDTDAKYLFPAYRIMHCGLGDSYIEYPLSKVLGSWGLTIRDIWMWGNGTAEIKCYGGKNGEITFGTDFQIPPLSALEFDLKVPSHYLDLILRYEEDGQRNLTFPKWAKAIWMNFGGCYVADAVGQQSHSIRFQKVSEDGKFYSQ